LRQISNAVDTERFRPASPAERASLRGELGLPGDVPIVLFVGFFSRDKRPQLLYEAWAPAAADGGSMLLFVGATKSAYAEVDGGLADTIRSRAAAAGLADRVLFVESSHTIERYFRAVDLYALPSIREGFPIALLEAMSSGLPCVATRLSGATDVIIEHGVNGLLVEPDDAAGFTAGLRLILSDRGEAARLGAAARQTVSDRFSIERTSQDWFAAYRDLSSPRHVEGADTP
jgi:glycosyltransferase involved in cell wall biosynthesis